MTAHLTNLYGPCTSVTFPEITPGSSTDTLPANGRSCLTLTGAGTGTETITWNTGQTSTLVLNFNAQIVAGVYPVTITGIVTDGLFHGDTVVRNHTGAAVEILLCQAGLGTVSSVSRSGLRSSPPELTGVPARPGGGSGRAGAAATRPALRIRYGADAVEITVTTGLRAVLSSDESVEVVGEAPDVVLMDVRRPRVDGIAATRKIGAPVRRPGC